MMMRNPIYEREMWIAAGNRRSAVSVTVFAALLSAVAFLSMLFTFHEAAQTGELQYQSFLEIFRTLSWVEFAGICALIPARTAAGISGERERGTMDLVLTTPITPMDLSVGILQSALSDALEILLCSMPPFAAVLLYGGVRFPDLLLLMAGCLAAALFAGSLGLFFSACSARTSTAVAVTYAVEVLLFFGPFLILFLSSSIRNGGTPDGFWILLSPVSIFYAGLSAAAGSGTLLQNGVLSGSAQALRHLFLCGILFECAAALCLTYCAARRTARETTGHRRARPHFL